MTYLFETPEHRALREQVRRWATAEVALAPLAVGEYALRLRTERSGKTSEVVTGFRIVP